VLAAARRDGWRAGALGEARGAALLARQGTFFLEESCERVTRRFSAMIDDGAAAVLAFFDDRIDAEIGCALLADASMHSGEPEAAMDGDVAHRTARRFFGPFDQGRGDPAAGAGAGDERRDGGRSEVGLTLRHS
jgi:hypothetical protein